MKSISLLAFLWLPTAGVQVDPAIEMDMLNESDWIRAAVRSNSIGYRRQSDGTHVSIRLVQVAQAADVAQEWKRFTLTMELPKHRLGTAPSGWRLGESVWYWPASGGLTVKSRLGRLFIECQATYRGVGERGRVHWLKDDPEGDVELVEGAVRHAIARLAAREFTTGANASVSGQSVSGTLRDGNGRVLVSLDGWATARGVSPHWNKRLGRISVEVDGKTVIMALGTDEIRIEGQKRSLGQMLVRRGEKWYAPLASLENLTR